MHLSRLLNWFGWGLVAAAGATFCGSFFASKDFFDGLKNAVPAGVLLALAGHLFTQAKTLSEAAEKRSLFALEGVRLAYAHAKGLLEDGNNDRAKWIEAARSISNGLELTSQVNFDAHQRVLEVERLKQRGFFHQLLSANSASFYYGVPQLFPSLGEAAAASTAPHQEHGRHIISTHREIGEASIRMVWLAAQWPEDYKDPLGGKFESNEKHRLSVLFPALSQYLEHKRLWHSEAGKLYPGSTE